MNSLNIRGLHEELDENEVIYLFFESQSHNIFIINPTDKVSHCRGNLIVENNDYKQIISLDRIIRACKRRVF